MPKSYEKLRSMQAHVDKYSSAEVILKESEESIEIGKCLVLTSYTTKVAVYAIDDNTLYLLPDYDCSRTTARQISAFAEDFTDIPYTSIIDIRGDAKSKECFCKFAQRLCKTNGKVC